ncbi:MAG: DUF3021 family protein [Lachnospiraceae bacterium]|nr:DUF3021 family protein [Lachnospiraceae bacterium]
MNQKNTILDFFNQVFVIFGITVVCLMVFVALFGEDAEGVSTIFGLGDKGITIATLLQYLLLSVLITALRLIYFTDKFMKKAAIALRTFLMFVSIIITIAVFAMVFGWFPVHMWQAWLAFFVCFGISAGISTAVSVVKEKTDNEKLQAALESFCEGEES